MENNDLINKKKQNNAKNKSNSKQHVMHKSIELHGIKTHGLKNISLEIPHDKLTIVTGLSGSGKSSLAIDTIFCEGQRRYLESLSSYARQFLNKFEKPDFEKITGLRPAIAIEQKTQGYNPRSTVGTVTEIYDYLRVLYARIGIAFSPYTHKELRAYSPSEITDTILQTIERENQSKELEVLAPLAKNRKGTFKFELSKMQKNGFSHAIIDGDKYDLDIIPDIDKNLFHDIDIVIATFDIDHCERYEIENACMTAMKHGGGLISIRFTNNNKKNDILQFSANAVCPFSGFALPELSPRLFSFNNPIGACSTCSGLGAIYKEMSDGHYQSVQCKTCNGQRLNMHALCVKINDCNIAQVCQLSLDEAKTWIDNLKLTAAQKEISAPLILEISRRLGFLLDVGLDYLTLERSAETLSGGESQRIRLGSQIGAGLEGVLYILDEPSIGLHQQDNQKLINTLKNLRDLGNTIIAVEHDEETMRAADHIVEMGPKAGVHGGQVVFSGPLEKLLTCKESISAEYLTGKKTINAPVKPVDWNTCKKISIQNARMNNLKNLCVDIPLNHLVGVCGVSGSGKSTLIMEVLTESIKNKINEIHPQEPLCELSGTIPNFEIIDQSPIGRTPRSTPATYTGLMNHIRDWFAQLPESRVRGYTASRFSFNVEGGRCRLCQGEGVRHIEMHFLPDIQIKCEACQGQRYNQETCQILYEGLSIYDVLELTIEDALQIFHFIPAMKHMLQTLCDIHLGYLKLGQNATTLSGGEAQRLKLGRILGVRKHAQSTLYILDEPTTGLHFDDTQALLQVLRKLVALGNSVLIIEHHIDILKQMDWLIEIGPCGGKNGGQLIAQGPYTQLKKLKTPTGKFL